VRVYFDHSIVFLIGFVQEMDVVIEIAELLFGGVQDRTGLHFHENYYYKFDVYYIREILFERDKYRVYLF
jgi:hypothetical protein